MSIDTSTTDSAQPQGQGDDQSQPGSGLYDLSSVPAALRPHLEAELKKIEGNVTRRFQEHADYRKRWEPLEQLGIGDVDPKELQELLQFRQIAGDPDQFRGWWQAVGEQLGLFEAGDDSEAVDDDDGDDPNSDLRSMLEEMLDQRLGPIEQERQQAEAEKAVEAEMENISTRLAELHKEHGEFDDEAVCKLALAYADEDDPIAAGLTEFQRITGGAQRSLVDDKMQQPEAPVRGGRPASTPDRVTSFSAAAEAAKERLRASR